MKYLFIMFLVGCASVGNVKQPYVDIGIDGQPQIIETLDSASEPVTNMIGAGIPWDYKPYRSLKTQKNS